MRTIRFRLRFLDELLATTPGNEEIYADYIATKAYNEDAIKTKVADRTDSEAVKAAKEEGMKNAEEEKEALHEMIASGILPEEELEKATTYFFKDEQGNPYIYAYWLLGFFKGSCGALRKVKGTLSSKIKAYKKEIDMLFKVYPDANDVSTRKIRLENYGKLGMCERPLRAQTMQGERVALSRSESAQPGTEIEFDVVLFRDEDENLLMEWMEYGKYNGLGQWRSSGKGAFVYEIIAKDGKEVKKKSA